ncbi:type 4a pilus biogenesis protein PilO, partial [bacterium]|nr:type 4a pilus biogenesis protein PilO [bacterium]
VRQSLNQRSQDYSKKQFQENLSENLERVNRWIPPETFLPNLINQFQELAEIMSLQISSVNYKFEKDTEKLSPLRIFIQLNVSGKYPAIRAFLQALESLPFPLVPIEIMFSDSGNFSVELLHLVKP